MFAREAAATPAGRLPSGILQTYTLVVAITHANVRTLRSSTVVSWFTFALEVTCLWYKQTIGICVAVHFFAARFARIRTIGFAGL